MNIKIPIRENGLTTNRLIGTIPTPKLTDRADICLKRIDNAKAALSRNFTEFEKSLYGIEIDEADYRDELKQVPIVLAFIVFELGVRGEHDLAQEYATSYAELTGRDGVMNIPIPTRLSLPDTTWDTTWGSFLGD